MHDQVMCGIQDAHPGIKVWSYQPQYPVGIPTLYLYIIHCTINCILISHARKQSRLRFTRFSLVRVTFDVTAHSCGKILRHIVNNKSVRLSAARLSEFCFGAEGEKGVKRSRVFCRLVTKKEPKRS